MRQFNISKKSIPLVLLFVAFLAFGILIPWLGFYWDDLPIIWRASIFGPASMLAEFQGDRPLFGFIFMLTTSIFKQNLLAWQIFAILCRWLVALAAWWTFNQVWPKKLFQNTFAALLIIVFPGFSEHWISVAFSNIYLVMLSAILSIGFTIKAIREPDKFWIYTFLSVLTAAYNLFSIEYFFGQEFLRPFFIWFILSEKKIKVKHKIVKTLEYWAPTLFVLIIFLFWRVFFFESNRYSIITPGDLHANVITYFLNILKNITNDFIVGAINGWSKIFSPEKILDWGSATIKSYWVLILICLALLYFIFDRLIQGKDAVINNEKKKNEYDEWAKQAMLSGFCVSLIATLPYVMAGLNFSNTFPNDRNAITLMVGSSLLFTGLVDYFIQPRKKQIIIASIVISLAIGTQYTTANTYRRDWDQLKYFLWQLTWRVPAIKPGTMIISNELPFAYYTDNSLTAPINWIYSPTSIEKEIPYMFVFARLRSQSGSMVFSPDSSISAPYRAVHFTGNTSNSFGLYLENPGCIRIINKQLVNELLLQKKWDWIDTAASLSNLNTISSKPESEISIPIIFGIEPAHDWCYYFQKADLARQNKDWNEVVNLADSTKQQGLTPKIASEYFPFIEGYLYNNQINRAEELLKKIIEKIEPEMKEEKITRVCTVLTNMESNMRTSYSPDLRDWFITTSKELGC
jgi:hypothetical protein